MMHRHILSLKRTAPWGVLTALLALSLYNQFDLSWRPLYLSRMQIPAMIMKNDMQKLEALAPDLSGVINAINAFPTSTRFYFIPCFEDSGNTGRWWWYVHLLSRYLSYPRIIFAHDKVQYGSSKEGYRERFIRNARTWNELDWISSRNIQVLILMRRDTILFLQPTDPIGGL